MGGRLEAVERQTDKCARCWLEKSTRVERGKEWRKRLVWKFRSTRLLHFNHRTTTVAATGYTSPAGAYKSTLGAEH